MLSVIINSQEYSLDDGTYGTLISYDGWGMSPSKRIESQGPLQHGVTDEGQYLQARYGALTFLVAKTGFDELETARGQILELFHPENSPSLVFTQDKGTFYFDCFYSENLTMPWKAGDGGLGKYTVVLKCPDPTCYDPTVNVTQWLGFGTGSSFQIPWVVNTFVGAAGIDQTKQLNYYGTWYEYPEIEITGPADNPIITNETNGYKLDFTGLSLATGEKRIIDTRYGYKTVIDGSNTNQISDLTSDSDLAAFRLERKRIVDIYRTNNISFSASATDSNTSVIIRWKNRYIGV